MGGRHLIEIPGIAVGHWRIFLTTKSKRKQKINKPPEL
jgi:hypothetical protein